MDYMPFNSVAGDRIYKAEDWAWYFGMFISNGVFANPTSSLQVVENAGMAVNVKPGCGFINGYAFRNTTNTSLTLDAGDGVYDRIDRIVLRWDLDNRMMLLATKKGTPSSSPVAPTLTRTSSVYELALADIRVARGAVAVSQVDITDQRANTALCNFCVGMVDQIDWSDLTAQLSAFMAQTEQDLMDYMQYIHDILDSETASHLLNLINALQADKVNKSGDTMTGNLNVTGNIAATGTVTGDIKTPESVAKHLSDTEVVYVGTCSSVNGATTKIIELTKTVAAMQQRPLTFETGARFALNFSVKNAASGTITAVLRCTDGDLNLGTVTITFPNYDYAGEYVLFRLDGSGSTYKLKPVISGADYLGHELFLEDANENDFSYNGERFRHLKFRRIVKSVYASDWSNSANENGYFTYIIALGILINGYNPVWLRPINNSDYTEDPTAAELAAYNLVDKALIPDAVDAGTITLYARTKPTTTFYLEIRGTHLR